MVICLRGSRKRKNRWSIFKANSEKNLQTCWNRYFANNDNASPQPPILNLSHIYIYFVFAFTYVIILIKTIKNGSVLRRPNHWEEWETVLQCWNHCNPNISIQSFLAGRLRQPPILAGFRNSCCGSGSLTSTRWRRQRSAPNSQSSTISMPWT